MVNRILNSQLPPESRAALLALLNRVPSNPRASEGGWAMAEQLLEHHATRRAR
jgi:hypothetical protein